LLHCLLLQQTVPLLHRALVLLLGGLLQPGALIDARLVPQEVWCRWLLLVLLLLLLNQTLQMFRPAVLCLYLSPLRPQLLCLLLLLVFLMQLLHL
jgi:hypothetical protein